MNKRQIFLIVSILLLASCQREMDVPDQFKAPDITAEIQAETRTVLSVDEYGAGTIYWKTADQIDVFIGENKLVYTSQNSSNATTATFKTNDGLGGNYPDSEPVLAIYPSYEESYINEWGDRLVCSYLPSQQYGLPGTFDDDLFMAVATGTKQNMGSSTPLSFHNICSGLKFSLSRDDITCVKFRGTDTSYGDPVVLAGDVFFEFDGSWSGSSGGATEITLYPKSGSTFQKDAYYYIICFPASLMDFYVDFVTTSGASATLRGTEYNQARGVLIDEPFEFRKSIFMKKTHIDEYAKFSDEDVPHTQIKYWTSGRPDSIWQNAPEGGYYEWFGVEPFKNESVFDQNDGIGYGEFRFNSPVTRIGPSLFKNSNLTQIHLPMSITEIGSSAFEGSSSLTYLSVPQSLISIGSRAFYGCTSLESRSLYIPDSVTSIGSQAYENCLNLTSLEIPSSVTDIGVEAFGGCVGLASIIVDSSNPVFDSRENCNAIIRTDTNELVSGCKNTVIPNSVTKIGACAFYGCSGLASIEIPSSVSHIGISAFTYCTGLTSITVYADTPPQLDNHLVFSGTNNCPIYVPAGSVAAYKSAWSEYADRIQAMPSQNNVIYYTSTDGQVVTPNKSDVFGANIISNEYVNGRGVITFDGDVTSIGKDAFNAYSTLNSRLTSIEIPSTVTSIGYAAFYCCSNLISIVIPDSVSSIGQYAFRYCSALESIEIPNTVSVIDSFVFDGCSSLIAFDIPDSVTSIGRGAFSDTGLSSIEIPSSVTTIDLNPFERCQRLASIIVDPDNAAFDSRNNCNAIIRKDNNALISGCMNTIIPDSVKRISGWAFLGCTGLSSIEIPSSVEMLAHEAFLHCLNLTSVTVYAITPPTLNDDTVFDDTNDCPIYVPAQSVNAYKSAWSVYADRIQAIPDIHEAVDLGLSVKWATCNVGASSPEEYGDYFAWGETEPKSNYDWSTYKWCNGSENTLTKYCSNSSYGNNGFTDNKTVLDLEDDAARVNWGGSWRMPTEAEWTELRNNCTRTWTTQNGVNGYRVTSNKAGYTDRSIFLPSAGYKFGTSLSNVGSSGNSWSSSVGTLYPNNAWEVNFYSGSISSFYSSRCYGFSVRPVYGDFIYVDGISLNKSSLSITEGETSRLSATVMPANATEKNVSWSSNNTSVATVSPEGFVTAVSAGTATITTWASDGVKSATCALTVLPKAESN